MTWARVEAQASARIRTGQTGRVRQTLEIDRAKVTRPFFSADPLSIGTASGFPVSSTA